MKKSILALLLVVLMAASLLTIGAAADEPVKGSTAEHPFTTVEEYKTAIADPSWDGKDIYLTIKDEDFVANEFNLTNVQSRVKPPKLHLTLIGCTFNGNTSGDGDMTKPVGQRGNTSFMYLSNCQELYIDGCTFNTGNDSLKYGINWNLIQITNATVEIKNSTFTGTYEENAIKLNQRNGADDKAKDIKYDSWNGNIIAASIKSALIENVEINSNVAVILLGSAAKGDGGAAAPSTGAFPVTISNVTTSSEYGVVVFKAYLANRAAETAAKAALASGSISEVSDYVKVMDANETISKTANGDLASDEDFVAEVNGDKYTSLQSAIDAATSGATITVAPGTYDEVVTFGGKSLTIKAQYPAYYNGVKLSDESGQLSKFTGTFYTGADSNPVSFNKNQSITIIGFALSGNGLKIGTTNWSTVGSLTVKNCTMEFGADLETTSYYNKFNKFIYVNGGANGAFANFVVEDNFVKGTPSGSNNPIQLWGVQSAKVANNMIILENAATFEAISISKLASNAKINVYGNTIIGAGSGVSITTWLCNNDSTGGTAFEGDVSIENNTFTNVNKPIFVGYQKVENVPYAAFEGTLNYDGNTNNGVTVIPELGQKPGATAYYTVKVDPANGGKVDTFTVRSGNTFTTYAAPYNPGYAFLGWACSDGKTYGELKEVTITADTTFTASWVRHPDTGYVPEPEEPEEPEVPAFPFYDVPTSAWYYTAVKYVYDNKLMDGVDTYVFAPNDTLTRAMVWTIIARMSGVDTTGGANWYAKAQEWVVVNGISDGENPTAAITREQLVTMLYRYAQIKGYDVSVGENTNILSYVDATSISEYAVAAFQWACGSGLTEGDENGALTPLATATRAQAAAMIMRFLSK